MRQPKQLGVLLRYRAALERMQDAKLQAALRERLRTSEELKKAQTEKYSFQQQLAKELRSGTEAWCLNVFSEVALENEIQRRATELEQVQSNVAKQTAIYLSLRQAREVVEKLVDRLKIEIEMEHERKRQSVQDDENLRARSRRNVKIL